jgi:hypothetical protein
MPIKDGQSLAQPKLQIRLLQALLLPLPVCMLSLLLHACKALLRQLLIIACHGHGCCSATHFRRNSLLLMATPFGPIVCTLHHRGPAQGSSPNPALVTKLKRVGMVKAHVETRTLEDKEVQKV